MRLAPTALALSLVGAPLSAQRPATTSPAITAADLKSRLYRIADDSMMGRETGSKGAYQTADYVAAEFKRLGLTPAGDGGTWFQSVPFWTMSNGLQMLTPEGGAALRAGIDFIVVPRASSTTLDSSVAMYAGAVGDSTTWPDAASMRGRLIVLDGTTEGGTRWRTMISTPAANQRFAGVRAIAVVQMDRLGAADVIDIPRARVTADSSRRALPVILLITTHAAEQLLGNAPRATGSSGRLIRADGVMRIAPTPFPARNVVGILPGRDPALRGEYMSLSGHNDHVGICRSAVDHDSLRAYNRVIRPMGIDTPDRTPTEVEGARINALRDSLRTLRPIRVDSICNGADDDGSGTVALLELAESFASLPLAQRPRRSLLFVSHTAEERGLLGSAWYTDHATVPVDSIVAEIDEDMVGRGAVDDLPSGGPQYLEVVGSRRISNEFGDLLQAANRMQKIPFTFDYEFDAPGHPLRYNCRADHYNYARYGIPAVAFSRGEHLDYHQVTDEAQYIDYDDMLRVVNLVHDAALMIANLDHTPKLDKPKGDPKARCVQ